MTQTSSPDASRFVVDTNALWWYLRAPERLSSTADVVFRLAEAGGTVLVVPAIVVAELYYLSFKVREPLPPSELMKWFERSGSFVVSDLGAAQLELLDRLPEIPEMHDRLIAAEALALGVPVVTRDPVIAASPQVQSIW